MADHDPKRSPAKIIRYNKKNPDEKVEVVKRVKGKAAAVRILHSLREAEEKPDKYAYYWTWENRTAAHEYDEEKSGIKPKRAKGKKETGD